MIDPVQRVVQRRLLDPIVAYVRQTDQRCPDLDRVILTLLVEHTCAVIRSTTRWPLVAAGGFGVFALVAAGTTGSLVWVAVLVLVSMIGVMALGTRWVLIDGLRRLAGPRLLAPPGDELRSALAEANLPRSLAGGLLFVARLARSGPSAEAARLHGVARELAIRLGLSSVEVPPGPSVAPTAVWHAQRP